MTPHCLAKELGDPQSVAAVFQLRITQHFGQLEAMRCHTLKAKHEHLRMTREKKRLRLSASI